MTRGRHAEGPRLVPCWRRYAPTWLARLLLIATHRPVELILLQHPLKTVQRESQLPGHCIEVSMGLLPVAAAGTHLWLVHRGT